MKINRVSFTINALSDYQYWQKQNRKTQKSLNKIIDDIVRHPYLVSLSLLVLKTLMGLFYCSESTMLTDVFYETRMYSWSLKE